MIVPSTIVKVVIIIHILTTDRDKNSMKRGSQFSLHRPLYIGLTNILILVLETSHKLLVHDF